MDALRIGPARSKIERTGIGFRVVGIAHVDAQPHRTRREAKAIADRIARDASSYLAAVAELRVPGACS
jgi:hypothetical protein